MRHSPTSDNCFCPSSCYNWSCAWLLFHLLRFCAWCGVEPTGGARRCCHIFLGFGFRLVGTLVCSVKEHLLFGAGENHIKRSLQPYFSMTYFHLLLPIPLQIAWFVQGTAAEAPAPSGSSNQLEVSTAVAGFTLAAMLRVVSFIIHNKTVLLRMETYFTRWLHETLSNLWQLFLSKQLLQLELCLTALPSSPVLQLVRGWTNWRYPPLLPHFPRFWVQASGNSCMLHEGKSSFQSRRKSYEMQPSTLFQHDLFSPPFAYPPANCLVCPRNRCRGASTLWVIKPTWGVHSRCWIHLGCNAAPESFHSSFTTKLFVWGWKHILHDGCMRHSPTSDNCFCPSSCYNWNCAWLLFHLLRFCAWCGVEPTGGIRRCCHIFLGFGFRLVGTLVCSRKEHLLFGAGENHMKCSLQPYFSMTYFHLLLPIPLQIAWFVQGTAAEAPAPSGSSNQLEVSTAVAGFTLAAMLHPSCFIHHS